MNCPYMWTNSVDEELASLEAPDGEGVWCWPRMNKITRWGKRVDPRPAFHCLAEDDEDEQVSGGLNHLAPRIAGGTPWTWKESHRFCRRGERDAEEHVPRDIH